MAIYLQQAGHISSAHEIISERSMYQINEERKLMASKRRIAKYQ